MAEEYNVKVFYSNSMNGFDGMSRYWKRSISLNCSLNASTMLATFFHEIGHIHCWDNSIWQSYHIDKSPSRLNNNEKSKFIRTALKAERWVEKWAKKEMKKHFPHLKYVSSGYSSKEEKDHFLKYVKNYVK